VGLAFDEDRVLKNTLSCLIAVGESISQDNTNSIILRFFMFTNKKVFLAFKNICSNMYITSGNV